MSVLAIINNSFNGNFEEAAHFYYKEANKLYFANIVLNNQVTLDLLSSRTSPRRRSRWPHDSLTSRYVV